MCEFVRNVTRYQMWSQPQIRRKRLAEELSGCQEDRVSGPCCMKAFLTLWLSMGFLNTKNEVWGLSPTTLLCLFTWTLCFDEVATTGIRKEAQQLFLKQPFWLSILYLSPSAMGEHGAQRKQGWRCWDGVRWSSDAEAAVPRVQGGCQAAPRRLTHTKLGTVLQKLCLLHWWSLDPSSQFPELRRARGNAATEHAQKHLPPNTFPGFWHRFVITQLYLIGFWKKHAWSFLLPLVSLLNNIHIYVYFCSYCCGWKLILGKDQHGIVESHSVLKRIYLSSSGRQSTVQPWQGAMVTMHLGKHIQKHPLEEHTGFPFICLWKKKNRTNGYRMHSSRKSTPSGNSRFFSKAIDENILPGTCLCKQKTTEGSAFRKPGACSRSPVAEIRLLKPETKLLSVLE